MSFDTQHVKPIYRISDNHVVVLVVLPKGKSITFSVSNATTGNFFNNLHAVITEGKLLREAVSGTITFSKEITIGMRLADYTDREFNEQSHTLTKQPPIIRFTAIEDTKFICFSHGLHDPTNKIKYTRVRLKKNDTITITPISYLCIWETCRLSLNGNILTKNFYSVKNEKVLICTEDTEFLVFSNV